MSEDDKKPSQEKPDDEPKPVIIEIEPTLVEKVDKADIKTEIIQGTKKGK